VIQTRLYGLAPSTAREGDSCCIIFGAKTPFIVRPITDSNEQYELVGEAHIHRIMKGEVVIMCDDGEFQEQISFWFDGAKQEYWLALLLRGPCRSSGGRSFSQAR
jgi:hypothetical protein